MNEVCPSQDGHGLGEGREDFEPILREFRSTLGHNGSFHDGPSQWHPYRRDHPKVMKATAAAEVENGEWPPCRLGGGDARGKD
ncbi:MAG: hypothetical protein WBE48_20175 [Xanthobacteraceae bacterium]